MGSQARFNKLTSVTLATEIMENNKVNERNGLKEREGVILIYFSITMFVIRANNQTL